LELKKKAIAEAEDLGKAVCNEIVAEYRGGGAPDVFGGGAPDVVGGGAPDVVGGGAPELASRGAPYVAGGGASGSSSSCP
jgi:hypothetical protein